MGFFVCFVKNVALGYFNLSVWWAPMTPPHHARNSTESRGLVFRNAHISLPASQHFSVGDRLRSIYLDDPDAPRQLFATTLHLAVCPHFLRQPSGAPSDCNSKRGDWSWIFHHMRVFASEPPRGNVSVIGKLGTAYGKARRVFGREFFRILGNLRTRRIAAGIWDLDPPSETFWGRAAARGFIGVGFPAVAELGNCGSQY